MRNAETAFPTLFAVGIPMVLQSNTIRPYRLLAGFQINHERDGILSTPPAIHPLILNENAATIVFTFYALS